MDKLKQRIKICAQRICNFLVNVNKTGKDKRTEAFLNARIQLLESYWEQYLQIYGDLSDQLTEEQLQADENLSLVAFSEIERAYTESVAWLTEQKGSLRKVNTTETVLNSTVNSSQIANQSIDSVIRLPKITLPSFNGSYSDWPPFRDIFDSLIHSNGSLSPIQKFHYLKSSIFGDALKLIKHLSVTAENYSCAWSTLTSRYENKRVLVNEGLTAIVNLQQMISESSTELRRVLDTFSQNVRALENLQRPVKQWDDWLIFFLSSKLDTVTRKDWETSLKSSTEIPSYEELIKFLEGRVHTLSAINSTSNRKQGSSRRIVNTVARHHSSSISSFSSCSCCKRDHLLLFCPTFRAKTVSD